MTKYKDNTAYSQNNTNSALERYAVDGYTPPAGVVGKEAVREMQRWLGGLTPDGLWGPKTQKQFDKAMAAVLKTAEVPPAPANAERLGYAEDIYKLSIGIGKSGRGNYMVRGYDPPANIKSAEDVRAFQEIHGLDVDGVWGERTKQRFGQLQQKWASQYDVDELARLAAEGLNKLTGEPGNALQAGTISLRSGKGAGIIPLSAGNGEEQTVGAQAGAKPAALSTSAMPNRAAKGYTIPQGVSDVAATQRMLGVTADGLWGEKTDSAYKKLVSGGNVPGSAQAVAAQLKQLYQDVAASNLSTAQKENARALLLALEQYGDPEYQRKTLLGIQMKGGAAAFFKQPGGPAWNAMIDTQNELYEDLLGRLEQKKGEIAQIPIWERIFSNEEYKKLQGQKTELEEQIMVVDNRLRQPGWNVLTFWDWSEVEDWERAQLIRDDAKNASAEKQARDEAAAEAKKQAKDEAKSLQGKNNKAKPIEELEISEKAIEVFIDREGNRENLKKKGIGLFREDGSLIGIYPHYANDDGITLGYGHHIDKEALEKEQYQVELYNKYAPGAALDGKSGKVPNGILMPAQEVYALLMKDIGKKKDKLIRGLRKYDTERAQNVRLTQQEFDALMLVSFRHGNVESVYDFLLDNNRNQSDWRKEWESTDKRKDIAFDIFFNGNYEARRE